MAIDLAQYQKLKTKADAARADAERAQGALEQEMLQLKREFGCKTIDDAETLLAELEANVEKAEATYNKLFEKFKAKWENDDVDV